MLKQSGLEVCVGCSTGVLLAADIVCILLRILLRMLLWILLCILLCGMMVEGGAVDGEHGAQWDVVGQRLGKDVLKDEVIRRSGGLVWRPLTLSEKSSHGAVAVA